ncbi:lysophospholipase L1-like esterase [Nocardioides thalensis]|uniref:Lysophospholipase L1-like esterase n=1 Tax=Nocardioides thalensis TaxID=1914755 RepID=A0A853C058_9ACTN|nr:lysophospholipase L1-like esterase [Nocardioides thalensis]
MRTPRKLFVALPALLAALVASVALAAPASADDRSGAGFREYVALGDSWSADVVFLNQHGGPDTTHAPLDCFQSRVNYPKLVAAALGVKVFRDATCGSATTAHFAGPQTGLPLGGTNPPQLDRLTRRTDLVTVGIGGNDAGIAAAAMTCISVSPLGIPAPPVPLPDLLPLIDESILPLGACKERFTAGGVDRLAQQIRDAQPLVVRALRQVRRRAPNARVLLVNYLDAIPERGCWPIVPITDADMGYLHDTFARLNRMLARAARNAGVELVDTHPLSTGHHVCSGPTNAYVEGLGLVSVNDVAVGVPAHPNSAGARAQAQSVLRALRP